MATQHLDWSFCLRNFPLYDSTLPQDGSHKLNFLANRFFYHNKNSKITRAYNKHFFTHLSCPQLQVDCRDSDPQVFSSRSLAEGGAPLWDLSLLWQRENMKKWCKHVSSILCRKLKYVLSSHSDDPRQLYRSDRGLGQYSPPIRTHSES